MTTLGRLSKTSQFGCPGSGRRAFVYNQINTFGHAPKATIKGRKVPGFNVFVSSKKAKSASGVCESSVRHSPYARTIPYCMHCPSAQN